MKKDRGLKSVILVFFLAVLAVGLYWRLSNKSVGKSEEEVPVKVTEVQRVLSRNLKTTYPPTPKEVIKYFSEITQCFYNETFESDEELEKLADQMLLLYDTELVNYKTHDDYMLDLKSDIAFYNANGYTISSFAPSASTDVETFEEDGFEWPRLWCMYPIKSGKYYKQINEVFILRKDEDSHWKIYGWEEVDG